MYSDWVGSRDAYAKEPRSDIGVAGIQTGLVNLPVNNIGLSGHFLAVGSYLQSGPGACPC